MYYLVNGNTNSFQLSWILRKHIALTGVYGLRIMLGKRVKPLNSRVQLNTEQSLTPQLRAARW